MPNPKDETPHPPGPSASPAELNLRDKDKSGSSPMAPNDRDETTGSTGGVPSERVQQGGRDLKRGIRDTSRGEETDRAYEKLRK